MAAAAAPASPTRIDATLVRVQCVTPDNKTTSVIIAPDETLSGMIDKIRNNLRIEFPVRLSWDCRAISRPIARLHSQEQYCIEWENHQPAGPEIQLSRGASRPIQIFAGVNETDKSVKVTREFFDKIQVRLVCDFRLCDRVGVVILESFGKLPLSSEKATAIAPPAQAPDKSTLASAAGPEETKGKA